MKTLSRLAAHAAAFLFIVMALACSSGGGGSEGPGTSSFLVTFDTDGGSAVGSQTVVLNGLVVAPTAVPTKNGYDFGGWYADELLTDLWDFNADTVTAATTIYVKWNPGTFHYAITYHLDGGANPAGTPAVYDESSDEFLLPIPSKSGTAFGGWYDNSALSGAAVASLSSGSTGDREYWAKWGAGYTVTVTANGSTATYALMPGTAIILPEIAQTKPDHAFAGWATSAAGCVEYQPGDEYVMGVANQALYEVWTYTGATLATLGAEGYVAAVALSSVVGQPLVAVDGKQYLPAYNGGNYNQTVSLTHHISPFEIGKFEVTYELWYTVRTWAQGHGYSFANRGREGNDGINEAEPTEEGKRKPVNTISWRDAIVWCNAYSEMTAGLTPCYSYLGNILRDSRDNNATACDNAVCDWNANGYRLPTYGEWRYAASCAGTYPGDYVSGSDASGDDTVASVDIDGDGDRDVLNDVAWFYENSGGTERTVGTKKPNRYGLFDMSGNVVEWCWDYSGTGATGTQINYCGPASGTNRRSEGGCAGINASMWPWAMHPSSSYKDAFQGFRVARRP